MDAADLQIRRLAPTEAALYREIRLEALRHDPDAFSSTFESEDSKPLTWFADRLTGSEILGAFRKGELCGTAALLIAPGPKEDHKGFLWGMYVRPNARGLGVGQRLGEAIINVARSRIERILLTVVRGNEPAQRLYAGLGFQEYGIEKSALKKNGRYYDEILMAKALRRPSD